MCKFFCGSCSNFSKDLQGVAWPLMMMTLFNSVLSKVEHESHLTKVPDPASDCACHKDHLGEQMGTSRVSLRLSSPYRKCLGWELNSCVHKGLWGKINKALFAMANGKDSRVLTGPLMQVPFPGTSRIVKAREGKWTGDCLSWGMGRRDHSGAIFLVGQGGRVVEMI